MEDNIVAPLPACLSFRTITRLVLLVWLIAILVSCGGGGTGGSGDPVVSDWVNYSNQVAKIESGYIGLPTRINLEPIWFKSLNVKSNLFSSREHSFTVNGNPMHGVGYGSFSKATNNSRFIFYSNWVPEQASSGSAFALEYVNDVPSNIYYTPIEGATHSWTLNNQNGSKSIVFMGVDEGKVPGGNATSPIYYFDISSRTWTTSNIISTSHNSIPFDYDSDGDDDIVSQSWHEPFDGKPFILQNDGGGSFTPIQLGDSSSGMAVAPLGFQIDGNFWIMVLDGINLPALNIGTNVNYILKISPDLTTVLDAIELPAAYFESPAYANVSQVIPNWINVGISHDVSGKAIDLDYDGDMDLIVSSMIWSLEHGYNVLQVLINDNGIFVDETESRLYNWFLPGGGQHRLDFIDFNGDGHVDILTSDLGYPNWSQNSVLNNINDIPPVASGSRVLVNDGTGHFVTVVHQQINETGDFLPSFIPALDSQNRLRWTMFDPRGTSNVSVKTRYLNMALSTGPNMTDPSIGGAAGFNEFYYLLQNPDVVTSIQNGDYETGLDHYLTIGQGEGRPAAAPPPP